MKNDPGASANALALTVGVVYVTCATAVALFPEFTMQVAKSWFHGIDLSLISAWNITAGSLVLGFITAVLYAWFVGFVFAWAYIYFLKK